MIRLAESVLCLTTRRSLGDILLGRSMVVWHDKFTSERKQRLQLEAQGGGDRRVRAMQAWEARQAKIAKREKLGASITADA